MPAFNAENTIIESINSVLAQTYNDFRLYIINDCSQDNTSLIVNNLTDSRITIINNAENYGVAKSRNLALSLCKGKFIAFLDSDDLWEPRKLEKQIEVLNSGWDLVCSNYTAFSSNIHFSKERISRRVISYSDMLKSNSIGNLTGIYNSDKIGKIPQKNIGHEDYLMWLEIIRKCEKAYCIQESLAKYRLSNTSLSGNKLKAIQWQWLIYRTELHLSLPKSIYYFAHYILNAFKKRR